MTRITFASPIDTASSATPRYKGVLGRLVVNIVNTSAKIHFSAAAISKSLQ